MNPFMLYLVVALGTFMSYIHTPTFEDAEARVVLNRLFFGRGKTRKLEWLVFILNVFAGAGVAYILLEPSTPKLAMVAGLGWTSVASIARTTVGLSATGQQPRPPSADKPPGTEKTE
ncbi:MAG TPA: hypothetical protein VFZ44_12735 [Pyrinomonadaceae bacterium]